MEVAITSQPTPPTTSSSPPSTPDDCFKLSTLDQQAECMEKMIALQKMLLQYEALHGQLAH